MSLEFPTQTLCVEELGPGEVGASPPVLLAGEVVAEKFRIVRGLGHGGMGQVYEALDMRLDQSVALKVIRPELALLPGVVERFKTEVRLGRRITHPNVCRIFDLYHHLTPGRPHGRLVFLTMELIRGRTLAAALRQAECLRPAEAEAVLRQMAAALSAAHAAGIVHGDLKPGNVMLAGEGESARVVVTDFGLALAVASQHALPEGAAAPQCGIPVGTPAYMAPEQQAGAGASPQSDIHAFGLVAYETLTGRRFSAQAPPLSALVPRPPPNLETLVLRCLDPEPHRRPRSARLFLDEPAILDWRPWPGQVLPRRPHWLLERRLGEGGFGEVWLARHRKTRETRGLKFCYDAARLMALQREVTLFRLLRRELGERDDLNRVLDWSFDTEPYYLETEYTAGGDLRTWAEAQGGIRAVARDTRLDIAAQVAETLAAVHAIGVMHRDVKPANILIDDRPEGPRARLADFGVGSVLDERRLANAEITVLGFTGPVSFADAGTRLYAAPELIEGRASTVQADIYAFGVMLFQMVAGDFTRALAPGWQRWVDDDLLASDIAAAVDGDPERRPGARELADRLRRLELRRAEAESHRQLRAQVERSRLQLVRSQRRRRVLTAALGVAMVVAVTMGWLVRRISKEATRARDAARIAVAVDHMDDDPTVATLALLEVERPGPRTRALMP